MKIIGFNINEISAKRNKSTKEQVQLKTGINIDEISEEDINITNQKGLKLSFTFKIEYSPEVAEILIKGSVLLLDDKNDSKKILKDWKNKIFDHPIKLSLLNFIMSKCNLKAISLEDEIGVPIHIPLPKLKPQNSKDSLNYSN